MSDDEGAGHHEEEEDEGLEEGFKGFFQPCYLQKQGSLAPTWSKRWFVFNVKRTPPRTPVT